MTLLEWDKVGDRIYQTGIDRGVLYPKGGPAVPWNGLASVDDGTNTELKSYYLDGVKILDHVTPGDFVGKLKAFTYPEEFDRLVGLADIGNGIFLHEQPSKSFNLSYRTRVGNDVEGTDHGYKIHLLYNLVAIPDSSTFETLSDSTKPIEFAWSLTGTPPAITGYRPTVHVTIDSEITGELLLQNIEEILYGSATTNPRFPTMDELVSSFGTYDDLVITDNGDGTWTATDHDGDFISMIDADTFQIAGGDATYSDPDTYHISSTNV